MNVEELRKLSKMSRNEFCEYFEIPYRTLQNWELKTRECPEYVLRLIEYKLLKEGLIEID